MLIPMALVRPIRSPRFPSAIPPMAAPNINEAVNHANHSAPSPLVYPSANKLWETDKEATGIRPNSIPSKRSPRLAEARTSQRIGADNSRTGLFIESSSGGSPRRLRCCRVHPSQAIRPTPGVFGALGSTAMPTRIPRRFGASIARL